MRSISSVRKIKVCYIIGQLGKGGAEKQLYELVRGIDREKFHPAVICLSKAGYWSGEIRKLDVEVMEIKRTGSRDLFRLIRLIRLLLKIRPSIIHTYMFSANTYGRIAAIITRAPIIIASERSLAEVGKDKSISQVCIDRLLAVFSEAIICNSGKASSSLVKKHFLDEKKVFTIHNGINTGDFNKRTLSGKAAETVIGTIGGLYPSKNHKLFLDTAKIILEQLKDRDIKFLIVGKGPLEDELRNYADCLGVRGKVVFTGERDDIPELLQNMDIFVMTSLFEGMPNAVMEAMSSGLPVVATAVGGSSELVVDGETGYLCPVDDVAGIAGKVIFLLNNQRASKIMGQKGRERILNEFTVSKMIRGTEGIYMKFLEQKQLNFKNI